MRDEAEEFDVEAAPPARPPRLDPAPRSVRSAIGWFLAGLALVGAGVLITPSVGMTDRNIAPDLSQPPQLRWQIPLESTRASDGDVWIDSGHVVAASSNAVRGVELDTAEVAWEVRGPQLTCARDAADIACVSRQGARSELIELTAGEGETSRTVHPDLVAALPAEGGTFAMFDAGETISVMRWGSSGEHVWTHRTHADEFGRTTRPGRSEISMGVADGALLITVSTPAVARPSQIALDIVDGRPRTDIRDFVEHDGEWLVAKDHGAWVYDRSGQSSPLAMTGWPLRVDDNPSADTVFDIKESGMRALSHRDSEHLWDFSPEPPRPVLPHARLDGTLVAWSEGTLHGLNDQNGTLLWERDSVDPRCPCLGDGNTLAHVTGSDESILTGIDVTSGEQIWQAPIAEVRTVRHATDGDHLAVYTVFGLSLWALR